MEETKEKLSKGKEEPVKKHEEKNKNEILVRILSTDIPGSKNIYVGLTKIKGISYSMSNVIIHKLKLDKKRKISSLSKEEIEMISQKIKNLEIPEFLMNRRKDYDTGESKHLTSTDLDLRKEFDIKRLKKIKSYKGIRHTRGLPVRGQRTKSHFRKKGKKKAVRSGNKK